MIELAYRVEAAVEDGVSALGKLAVLLLHEGPLSGRRVEEALKPRKNGVGWTSVTLNVLSSGVLMATSSAAPSLS